MNSAREFDEVDHGRENPIDDVQLDMSVARAQDDPLEINRAGSFLYLSDESIGKVYVRLNSRDGVRFPMSAGGAFANLKFRRFFLDWEAQPTGDVQIIHGVEGRFIPTNDIANLGIVGEVTTVGAVTSITEPLPPYDITGFTNLVASGAGTLTYFTPSANVNGAIVYVMFVRYYSATTGGTTVLTTGTAAPTGTLDGEQIGSVTGGTTAAGDNVFKALFVPAGRGLFHYGSGAGAVTSAFYKLL